MLRSLDRVDCVYYFATFSAIPEDIFNTIHLHFVLGLYLLLVTWYPPSVALTKL